MANMENAVIMNLPPGTQIIHENVRDYKVQNHRAHFILGLFNIVLPVIIFILELAAFFGTYYGIIYTAGVGFWPTAFQLTAGILAVFAGRKSAFQCIRPAMAFDILGAIFHFPSTIYSFILAAGYTVSSDPTLSGLRISQGVFCLISFIALVVHSGYCCSDYCCAKQIAQERYIQVVMAQPSVAQVQVSTSSTAQQQIWQPVQQQMGQPMMQQMGQPMMQQMGQPMMQQMGQPMMQQMGQPMMQHMGQPMKQPEQFLPVQYKAGAHPVEEDVYG